MTANFKSIPTSAGRATNDGCGYLGAFETSSCDGWPAISLSYLFFIICSWNDLSRDGALKELTSEPSWSRFVVNRRYTAIRVPVRGLLMSAIPALAVYAIFRRASTKA
jgi:hypothetical protein